MIPSTRSSHWPLSNSQGELKDACIFSVTPPNHSISSIEEDPFMQDPANLAVQMQVDHKWGPLGWEGKSVLWALAYSQAGHGTIILAPLARKQR